MSGNKKKGKQKKPTQGERLDMMEGKLQLILDRISAVNLSERPLTGESPQCRVSSSNTQLEHASHAQSHSESGHTPSRQSRPRTRDSCDGHGEVSNPNLKEFSPRNRQRARTSTPHHRHKSPRTSSADCTPARRPQPRHPPCMYSPADILDSPAAKSKARQILEILDPASADQGKNFDPYYNGPARYPMPRLYINNTAQKIVKQYRHFDDLTLPQFIEGYACMIDNEKSQQTKSYMLMHFSEIGVMLQDFPWDVVRDWTNAVLSATGQGSYKWSDGHRIEKEKVSKMMTANASAKLVGFQQGRNACLAYNATKCQETGSHGHNALHVCSFCFAAFGAEHEHPVIACNKRTMYKRGRERGDYSRSDRSYRQDTQEQPFHRQQQEGYQSQAGKGRGAYAQNNQYKPPYQYRPNWSQPPPEIKNWQQPA